MRSIIVLAILFVLIGLTILSYHYDVPFQMYSIGQEVDQLNDIPVYYNGPSPSVHGENISDKGYYLGVKWQCVEFVRRYYYQHFNHEMPSSRGNAKDYFNHTLEEGGLNQERNLFQFINGGESMPNVGDILILTGGYGHVGIVTLVESDVIEIIQQNVNKCTRKKFNVIKVNQSITIQGETILGWLSLKP